MVYLNPVPVPGNSLKMVKAAGLQAMPELEAGFFYDLISRAVMTVKSMKQAKTWPDLSITKCSQPMSTLPTVRSLDLMSAFKVISVTNVSIKKYDHCTFCLLNLLFFRPPASHPLMVHWRSVKMEWATWSLWSTSRLTTYKIQTFQKGTVNTWFKYYSWKDKNYM